MQITGCSVCAPRMSVAIYLVRILKRSAVTTCRRARWRAQYTNVVRTKNFASYPRHVYAKDISDIVGVAFKIDTPGRETLFFKRCHL